MSQHSLNTTDLLKAVAVTCIWGFNFSLIKYCLDFFDPYTLSGIRFLLCAFPLVFFIPKPDVPLKWIASYGLVFGVGVWGLVNLGVQLGASPGVSSLLLQTSAFFSMLFGVAFFAEKLTLSKLAGVLVAALGLLLIGRISDGSVTAVGIVLVVTGAMFWGVANVIIKLAKPRDNLSFLAWSSLFSPIPLFVMGYWSRESGEILSFSSNYQFGFVILLLLLSSYLATVYCYVVWNRLITRFELSQVAPLSLLVPVFGMLGSAVFYAEQITTTKIVASVLVLAGLLLALKSGRKARNKKFT